MSGSAGLSWIHSHEHSELVTDGMDGLWWFHSCLVVGCQWRNLALLSMVSQQPSSAVWCGQPAFQGSQSRSRKASWFLGLELKQPHFYHSIEGSQSKVASIDSRSGKMDSTSWDHLKSSLWSPLVSVFGGMGKKSVYELPWFHTCLGGYTGWVSLIQMLGDHKCFGFWNFSDFRIFTYT